MKKVSVFLLLAGMMITLTGCAQFLIASIKNDIAQETARDEEIIVYEEENADKEESILDEPEDSWKEEWLSQNEKLEEIDSDLVFDTVDIYGNRVTEDVIDGAKLILLNLWEPWCGPCVGEMPDLQELYDKYKDKGLLIIGAYTTFDMDEDARQLVEDYGITYPILKADDNLCELEQDYVPASYIFDGRGCFLEYEPIVGSRSYDDWEELILNYL